MLEVDRGRGRPPRSRSKVQKPVVLGKICKGVPAELRLRVLTPKERRQEGSVCSTRSSSSTKPLSHSISFQIPPKLPLIACSAQAWAITNGDTGKVLFGRQEEETREIASLTKIATCYLALQLVKEINLALSCEVVVSSRAAQMDGTSANLQPGDHLRLIDLFHALMLPSGNDAAQCLAEFFGRRLIEYRGFSQTIKEPDRLFVREMNTLCTKLHLRRTVFQNPHGMSQPRNHSCAKDVGALAAIAMRHGVFRTVVGTQKYTCRIVDRQGIPRIATWQNTNLLLSRGYEGMKTGVTDAAGPCLCASWSRHSQRLIITLLHSKSMEARWEDVEQLLSWTIKKD